MGDPSNQTEVIVTPLLPKDQYHPLENLRSQLYFIIREKLNENLLRGSLQKLIQEHLPVLGARIKSTGHNKALEYHLPRPFPEDYTLFTWSSHSSSSKLSDIKILKGPVREYVAITWGTPTIELEKLWIPEDWPLERKQEPEDCPLLLVHLTHYKDATVVSTSLPHAVADQMGYASVVEAWLAIAQGKTPKPFLQLEQNIFDTSAKFSYEDLTTKGQYRLKSLLERARVILSHALEVIWEQEEERRLLFLSEESITKLRETFNRSIRAKYGAGVPSLSSNDVVTAILVKLRYFNCRKPMFLSLSGTINARGRHPGLPAAQPFLHNALGYSDARFQMGPDVTAAEIAHHNRLAVNEAVKLENIERCFSVHEGVFHGGYSPHIGEPGDTTFAVTNWSGAWRNIDFTVASLSETSTQGLSKGNVKVNGTSQTSSMVVLGISMERSISVLRFSTQIMSKAEGGYWCDFSCSKKNMVEIDHLLERDPMLKTI